MASLQGLSINGYSGLHNLKTAACLGRGIICDRLAFDPGGNSRNYGLLVVATETYTSSSGVGLGVLATLASVPTSSF